MLAVPRVLEESFLGVFLAYATGVGGNILDVVSSVRPGSRRKYFGRFFSCPPCGRRKYFGLFLAVPRVVGENIFGVFLAVPTVVGENIVDVFTSVRPGSRRKYFGRFF